jgi:hypothetical protein
MCSDDFFKAQALLAREDNVEAKTKLKKNLQLKAELHNKGMAILVQKEASFESNNYRDASTKELDMLLLWYDVPKEKTKKAEKVARWREIHANNMAPPLLVQWMADDEVELHRIKNREIDMSETYLGRYAALQKRNAVAAVLDFIDEEWEFLKKLKEDDAAEKNEVNVADINGKNTWDFGMDDPVNGSENNEG